MKLTLTKIDDRPNPCDGDSTEYQAVVEGWTAHPDHQEWYGDDEPTTEWRVVVRRWWETCGDETGGNQTVWVEWREAGETAWDHDNRPTNACGGGDPNDCQLYPLEVVTGKDADAALLDLLLLLQEGGVVQAADPDLRAQAPTRSPGDGGPAWGAD